MTKQKTIAAYKGFDKNWKCRDFQYAVGETYTHDGSVKACESGFHACENPLEVFGYYPPVDSKFAKVTLSGEFSRESGGDTKVAAGSITVGAEIGIPALVADAVAWVVSQLKPNTEPTATNTGYQSAATNTGDRSAATNTGDQSAATNTGDRSAATNTGDQSAATNTGDQSAATNTGNRSAATNTGYQSAATNTGDQSAATNTGNQSAATNTGDQSAATNTGNRSAATNTGYQSAATNTGDRSAATNTGNRSAATNTGDRSAATNTGDRSAATVEGLNSVAIASGIRSKAKASVGGAIVVCAHDEIGKLIAIRASLVGENGIKPDVFYSLGADGEFVEEQL